MELELRLEHPTTTPTTPTTTTTSPHDDDEWDIMARTPQSTMGREWKAETMKTGQNDAKCVV